MPVISLSNSSEGVHISGNLSQAGADVECQIFQTHPSDVDIADLPSTWDMGAHKNLDTMTLPCSHHFNVSALALHFLTHDMRCPVCREGHPVKMDITSIPAKVRADFKAKSDSILTSMHQEESETVNFTFSGQPSQTELDMVEDNLTLTAEIVLSNNGLVILHAPIRVFNTLGPLDMEATDTTGQQYHIQRSMMRLLGMYIQKHAESAQSIRFGIRHPLLHHHIDIGTELIDFHAFHQLCNIGNTPAVSYPLYIRTPTSTPRLVGNIDCTFHPQFRSPCEAECVMTMGMRLQRATITALCLNCIWERVQQHLQNNQIHVGVWNSVFSP